MLSGIPWLVLLGTSITLNKYQPSTGIPYCYNQWSCTTLPTQSFACTNTRMATRGRLSFSSMTWVPLSICTEHWISRSSSSSIQDQKLHTCNCSQASLLYTCHSGNAELITRSEWCPTPHGQLSLLWGVGHWVVATEKDAEASSWLRWRRG